MKLQLLNHSDRFQVYALDQASVAAALKRLNSGGLDYIRSAVEETCRSLSVVAAVGKPFAERSEQVSAVLRAHYEALLTEGLTNSFADRSRETTRTLVALGSDVRCFFVMGSQITELAARRLAGKTMLMRRGQDLMDLALLQRLLTCDAATALTTTIGDQFQQEDHRRTTISASVENFESRVAAISSGLETASSAVQAALGVVTSAAEEALSKSRSAAHAAELGNSSLTACATSTEQLANATNELERRTEMSRQAMAAAEGAVSGAQAAIGDLQSAADKIGSIVGLIGSIAEQTNLLALNATIEAARAGDAGRGFAVVAQEVKALASQTTKATRDIVAQIGAVQNGTSRSAAEISEIGEAMDRLSRNASEVAGAVTQQNALTGELSRNLHDTVRQVISASEGYTAASLLIENTSAETVRLQNAMESLSEIGTDLKRDVDAFSAKLKAA